MKKYVYPAIFTPEADGTYSINFPDIPGCYTCGDDVADGLEMAEDVLALTLYGLEEKGESLPVPSSTETLNKKILEPSFVTMIKADTKEYRKRFNSKAVKKTLTIPQWINDEAVKQNVNFSKVLQDALIEQLHLN